MKLSPEQAQQIASICKKPSGTLPHALKREVTRAWCAYMDSIDSRANENFVSEIEEILEKYEVTLNLFYK